MPVTVEEKLVKDIRLKLADNYKDLDEKNYLITTEMRDFINAVAITVGLSVIEEIKTTLKKVIVTGTCPPMGGPLAGGIIIFPPPTP